MPSGDGCRATMSSDARELYRECTYEAIGIVVAERAFEPQYPSWRSFPRRLKRRRCSRAVNRRSRHDGLLRRRCLIRVAGLGPRRGAGARFFFHFAFASCRRHMPWMLAEGWSNGSSLASARTGSDYAVSCGGATMKTMRGCSRRAMPKAQRKQKKLARCPVLQCVLQSIRYVGTRQSNTLLPDTRTLLGLGGCARGSRLSSSPRQPRFGHLSGRRVCSHHLKGAG